MTNITPKGWLIYLHKQFSSWMCLPFKCQYKQLAETSQPKPHNCSQYLEFRMACHVWKGWEGFGRFGGALVNSTVCLAVLNGFVGSAVTNLYFCNTYLCCFNCEGNILGSNIFCRKTLSESNDSKFKYIYDTSMSKSMECNIFMLMERQSQVTEVK